MRRHLSRAIQNKTKNYALTTHVAVPNPARQTVSEEDDRQREHHRKLGNSEAADRDAYFSAAQQAQLLGHTNEARQLQILARASSRAAQIHHSRAASIAIRTSNPTPCDESYVSSHLTFRPTVALEQIDLHHLYVSEALKAAREHLVQCASKGVKRTSFITGWGKRSPGMVARVKPVILEWLEERKGVTIVDWYNDGVVVVELSDDVVDSGVVFRGY